MPNSLKLAAGSGIDVHASSPSQRASLQSSIARAVADIPEEDRLYRLPQVLSIIPMSRAKFLKMVKEGKAPAPIRCGRSTYYRAIEIKQFIEALITASRTKRPFNMAELVSEITSANK